MKTSFETCFTIKKDKVYFKPNIRLGGVSIYGEVPAGTIAGIKWDEVIGHDLEVEIDKKMIIIKGIY